MKLNKYFIMLITLLIFCAAALSIDAASDVEDNQCNISSIEGDGVCVEKSLCRSESATGPNSFDSRFNDDKDCPGNSEICCNEANVIKVETPRPSPEPVGCGYSNLGRNARARRSPDRAGYAEYAEFPWMVSLLLNEKDRKFSDIYFGGGTLIHPSVVMTVAHKVDIVTNPNQIKCRAGELNWTDDNELSKHQERGVSEIVIHPEYTIQNFDVALLFLSSPYDVTITPHIRVACLERQMPPPGTMCYSMGWGQDYLHGTSNAAVLKKITLPLVKHSECQSLYRNTQLGSDFTLHHTLTCAGGEANVDTCNGDGGSSLVCPIRNNDNNRYSVVGMVGYGLGCGKEHRPGVYVKVPAIYDWVIHQMTYQNRNSSAFVY